MVVTTGIQRFTCITTYSPSTHEHHGTENDFHPTMSLVLEANQFVLVALFAKWLAPINKPERESKQKFIKNATPPSFIQLICAPKFTREYIK